MDTMTKGTHENESVEVFRARLEEATLRPATTTSRWYWVMIVTLLAVIALGLYAWTTQLDDGLVVTGMRDRIAWGLYISAFVFFIGISHAGTLISAILRVTQAGWRTPITRIAEFITVVSLICGASLIIVDMGRPDRLLNVIIGTVALSHFDDRERCGPSLYVVMVLDGSIGRGPLAPLSAAGIRAR